MALSEYKYLRDGLKELGSQKENQICKKGKKKKTPTYNYYIIQNQSNDKQLYIYIPVMRPSRSLVSRVLTIPGCTQLAVTFASISYNIHKTHKFYLFASFLFDLIKEIKKLVVLTWSLRASSLVCKTLASFEREYARVAS